MKIIIQDPKPGEEDTVIISIRQMTDNVTRAINLLKTPDGLPVTLDGENYLIPFGDIYYAESVDLKTFVYAKKAVYRSRLKLYELEEVLENGDFLRVSKQVIVNCRKIKSVAPAGNSRFAATLLNGEKIIISRQYVADLKKRFGL